MKITFEGQTLNDVLDQMEAVLEFSKAPVEPVAAAIAPVNNPVDIAVGESEEKSPTLPTGVKPERTGKQKANDERLRAAAKAKAGKPKPLPPEVREAPPPASAESLGLAPDEMVKVRQKTIEDLQSAYANGFQKEVFELLSRFGNGAKSFRELPPESFVPIREAIDNGALT